MSDKEKVYDEQIAPLMAKIIEICKTEGIPMFADFSMPIKDFAPPVFIQRLMEGVS